MGTTNVTAVPTTANRSLELPVDAESFPVEDGLIVEETYRGGRGGCAKAAVTTFSPPAVCPR